MPAVVEVREETEAGFLSAVLADEDPEMTFRLAPAYTLYLVARYRASTQHRPELSPTERAPRLTALLAAVAQNIFEIIQVNLK